MVILTKLLSHKNGSASNVCISNYLSKSFSLYLKKQWGAFIYVYGFLQHQQPAIWDTERITTGNDANNMVNFETF